jgi:mono/diheme cytochrome c family protein
MVFRKQLSVLLVLGMLSNGALAQTAGDPYRGRTFAQQLCSNCHAVEGASNASPEPTAPPFSVAANTKGMTAMALSVWLQTSHPTMPNIRLRPDTLVDLVAYIMSLRRQNN